MLRRGWRREGAPHQLKMWDNLATKTVRIAKLHGLVDNLLFWEIFEQHSRIKSRTLQTSPWTVQGHHFWGNFFNGGVPIWHQLEIYATEIYSDDNLKTRKFLAMGMFISHQHPGAILQRNKEYYWYTLFWVGVLMSAHWRASFKNFRSIYYVSCIGVYWHVPHFQGRLREDTTSTGERLHFP